MENLFDPSFGALTSGGDMVKWLLKIVNVHETSVAKEPTKESMLLARESSKDASPTKDPGRDSSLNV